MKLRFSRDYKLRQLELANFLIFFYDNKKYLRVRASKVN